MDLHIIERENWSDLRAPGHKLDHPVRHVLIHCTVIPDVQISDAEMALIRKGDQAAIWRSLAVDQGAMRAVDRAHRRNSWGGFGYSFAGFDDGTCWEGRGWSQVGAHAAGWNSRSLGYAWFINGDRRRPTDEAWATFTRWLILGLQAGVIHPDFDLRPHRAVNTQGKTCPGTLITDDQIENLERFAKQNRNA